MGDHLQVMVMKKWSRMVAQDSAHLRSLKHLMYVVVPGPRLKHYDTNYALPLSPVAKP